MLRLMIGPDTAREFIALYREAGVSGLEDPSDEAGDDDRAEDDPSDRGTADSGTAAGPSSTAG